MYTHLDIETHFDGKLKIGYLNQPETFNSLNSILLKEISAFIIESDADESVRCIAISGRGKAFCSGQNLKDALAAGEESKDDKFIQKMVLNYYNPVVTAISYCKKPIISLVNGPAVGAGANLALICDFVLATESAYFSQAFSKIGLVPDTGGTYYLPKLIGRQMALYLAFTGKKLSANDAKNFGLVAEVFADADFDSACLSVLKEISEMPTAALALTKKAFNESYGNTLEQQLELEGKYQQQASETADFQEGIAAFVEKRKPIYQGK